MKLQISNKLQMIAQNGQR